MLDLIRPTSGRAFVFGIESTVDPVAIHRRIGYIPGEFALYDRLTGKQTLEYFANLRGGVDPAYQASLVERFDLDTGKRFKEYSKGNKQKVGVIAALQHQPELLVLDEPTSGLDPLVQQTFFETLRERVADGATVFLSSHILSEVEKTCDRVAIIRDGRLTKVDTVDGLRDLAHHQVELRFAGPVPTAAFEAIAGRLRPGRRGPHAADARRRADHAGRPGGRPVRAARLRLPRAVARGDVPRAVRPRGRGGSDPMAASTGAPRQPAATFPPIPLRKRIYGFGSIYGKTIRDSRLSFIIAAGMFGGPRAGHGRRASAPCSRRPRRGSRSTSSSAACRRRWSTCSATRR